jgi:Ca2+/Na+ antiporter
MLVLPTGATSKQAFSAIDLAVLATVMLAIFGVYLYMLLKSYASEEETLRRVLELDATQLEERKERTYDQVKRTSVANIAWLFTAGAGASVVGGERVSEFARIGIQNLNLSPIVTAIILAAFAGMSEYVILWRAHSKGQYRIALANAFGGITQVMFLVLPFTLLAISIYQGPLGIVHSELPLTFTLSNVLLFALLFPTFYVLIALIEEDHTLGALDTTIMGAIFLLIILILISYGGR